MASGLPRTGVSRLEQELFPKVTVDKRVHFVEEGALFSSAGISAGIDMSLRVVARYYGEAVARATARHMEYPFPKRMNVGSPWPNPAFERTAASALRLLAVPSSLHSSAAAQRERLL